MTQEYFQKPLRDLGASATNFQWDLGSWDKIHKSF